MKKYHLIGFFSLIFGIVLISGCYNPETDKCITYKIPEKCYTGEGIFREPLTKCCDEWEVSDFNNIYQISGNLIAIDTWCNEGYDVITLTCTRDGIDYQLNCFRFDETIVKCLEYEKCSIEKDHTLINEKCKDIRLNGENVIFLCSNLRKEAEVDGKLKNFTYPTLENELIFLNKEIYNPINYSITPIWYEKTEFDYWTAFDIGNVNCKIPSELCVETYCYKIMLKTKINYNDWRKWYYGK